MKNKKNLIWIVGILLLILLLIAVMPGSKKEPETGGISRAMAGKAVALALEPREELETWQKEYGKSRYPVNEQGNWYVIYMDYLYEKGYFSEGVIPAKEDAANRPITYGEVELLAGVVSPELKKLVKGSGSHRNEPYPQDKWWELYEKILEIADPGQEIQEIVLDVYGTPASVEEPLKWTAYTNQGVYGFEGLALDGYLDRQILVLTRGHEIVRVKEKLSDSVVYENVWLSQGEKDCFLVYFPEISRQIPYKSATGKPDKWVDQVADLYMKAGKLEKIVLKKDRIQGKVLSVGEDYIEIEYYGRVLLDERCQVFKTYGNFERQTFQDILAGYEMQEFVVAKGKICAVLTVRGFDARTIRVLLMDTGFKSIYHPSVSFHSSGAMTMIRGTEEVSIEAGTEIVLDPQSEELAKAGRLVFKPVENNAITVTSIERAQGQPIYGGQLEVVLAEEGLVLINDLYLEDYLTKVVPSEMPASYEKEALKAQAVCARTYAYMQIQGNAYSQYGAHVDDSTGFQVYNNITTDERTGAAVRETYGKMLTYGGKPVSAYYFSTSCGITTDGSVWGSEPEAVPYLKSVCLQKNRQSISFENNKEFAKFIKNKDYPSYDSDFPLYRWDTKISSKRLTEMIGGIGTVQDLSVTERGPGGIARVVTVKGSEGSKEITGQNTIRNLLGDESLEIRKKDGKKLTGWPSLPSAFIAIEQDGTDDNGNKIFHIYGGGYGHGAGMSQNGAQGMAKAGKTYEEILTFFYEGTEIQEISPDA